MIAVAVQRDNCVYAYNEKGVQVFSQYGQLQGYTGSTVSVKRSDIVYVYDERGCQISSYYSG